MKPDNDDDAETFQPLVDENARIIADRLRKMRKIRGWNQEDLAAGSGVPRGTISGIEAGAGTSRDRLVRFAMALSVPISVLIGESPLPGCDVRSNHSAQKPNFHQERMLLAIWRKLSPELRDHWLAVLETSILGQNK